MGYEPTVFNQLFNFIPRHTFQKSADRLGADRYLLLSYIKFMTKAEMSLTTMARRVKDGLMMRMDLMELLCLSPEKPLKPPDGQDATQMVFIL